MFGIFRNKDNDPTKRSAKNIGKKFRLACKMWGANIDVYAIYEDGAQDRIAEFADHDSFDIFANGLSIFDVETGDMYKPKKRFESV